LTPTAQKKQRPEASDKAESFAEMLRVTSSVYRLRLRGVDHGIVARIDGYLTALDFSGALRFSKRALSEDGIRKIAVEIAHIADERGMYDVAAEAIRECLGRGSVANTVIKHMMLMQETRKRLPPRAMPA